MAREFANNSLRISLRCEMQVTNIAWAEKQLHRSDCTLIPAREEG